jgi:hypothetical protein
MTYQTNVSTKDARAALLAMMTRAKNQYKTPAKLFRADGGGSFTDSAPGGRGMIYVRIYQGDGVQLTQAIDRLGVASPADDDKSVWLDKDPDGFWIVAEWRYEGT